MIYYTNVSNININNIPSFIPQNNKEKINSYQFDKDKKLSLGAQLLLFYGLKQEKIINPIFKKGKYEKPYCSNYNIHFNISHSGIYSACVINKTPVGIDIEKIDKTIDLNIAKNFFNKKEYESIKESSDPKDTFFKLWVLKESYMKQTGLGFNLPLDKFSIILDDPIKVQDPNNKEAKYLKMKYWKIEDYYLAVCSNEVPINPIEIKSLQLGYDLLLIK
ncbi:MAG: 4'-phosphopantetheinyl transferase superfamily protein [Methanobacteriaceae archaeon]|nr:4'-phosphopantetheinyl transferase superfamily protein [Methanobacteriaceae archaeon]